MPSQVAFASREIAMDRARKSWTIAEYERMIDEGILGKDDHVELIRGNIIEKAYITPRHAWCVNHLPHLFHNLFKGAAIIWNQNAVAMLGNCEPEPDIVLLRSAEVLYANRRPVASDVLLVGEVADTTLVFDRAVKLPLYAEAGIPEAWIVNLEEGVIEVYSEPANGAYRQSRVAQKGSSISLPGGLSGVVSVDEVLG